MIADLISAMRHPGVWLYSAWVNFLIKYRRTAIGPLWIVIGPALFVLALGELFKNVTAHSTEQFVPHLAAGVVIWNYFTVIATTAPRMYLQYRSSLLHGPTNHFNVILKVLCQSVIVFLHQAVIILVVMAMFDVYPTFERVWLLVPAFALLVVHSIWVLIVFGLIGARYRDLTEVVEMVMRIAFLATPILWMPGDYGKASIIGYYLAFNPFYHVLEPVRGAILGTPVSHWSWIVSFVLAMAGLILANILYNRLRHLAVLWT